MQPDDSVLYEVRIFVDGLCVAYVFTIGVLSKVVLTNAYTEAAFSVRGLLGPMLSASCSLKVCMLLSC